MWYNKKVRKRGNAHLHGKCVHSIVSDRKKVEFLSKEAISRVLGAEAQANAIRESAKAEARRRVSDCEADCARKTAEAIAKGTAENKARQAMVRDRAGALITQSREEASADIETMQTVAREKMREAVKHIEWELCDV